MMRVWWWVVVSTSVGCAGGAPAVRGDSGREPAPHDPGLVVGGASTMATGRARAADTRQGDRSAREEAVRSAVSAATADPDAVQVVKQSRRARVRKGTRIAARAKRLVGLSSLRKVTRRYPDDCTGLVRVAAEPEGVILLDGNARVSDNGVTAIWRRARAVGALHKRRPRPGDLIFFRETYDRNGDGKRNDGLTHIGIVEAVERDGTVTFVHRGGRGVARAKLNPAAPRDKKRNDFLRRADRRTRAYLTGELFVTYASSDKL